jgi:transposase
MAQPTYDQLLAENHRVSRQVEQLQDQVRQRSAQLQEALRAGKRQAAPFSQGPPKDPPKPPGRKAGPDYGRKAHRPIPDQPPDEIIDVPLPDTCPHCGGPTAEDPTAEQHQTEIPRPPSIRRFDLRIGHGRCCGKRIQPRHRLPTFDALVLRGQPTGPERSIGHRVSEQAQRPAARQDRRVL